jgi:hypothetical protein
VVRDAEPGRERDPVQWWLTDGDAVRVRVDAGGVLVGRSPRCDIVLRHPKASRSHALVCHDGHRVRLEVLGKGQTLLNDQAVARTSTLTSGDRLSLPGLELTLVSTREPASPAAGATWVLERPGGSLFGVSRGPFVVGGDRDDDLIVLGWPARALTLHPTQGRLHLTAAVDLEVDGRRVGPAALVALAPGSVIVHAGHRLRVVALGQRALDNTLVTDTGTAAEPLCTLRLELLPRGGRLHVGLPTGGGCVYLPGQRCDLMTLLLDPPLPHRVGDMLDDEYIIERLWPKEPRTRADLNTLVYRLRKDLVRAGLDASAVLIRAPGGGGTRLELAPEVVITVA